MADPNRFDDTNFPSSSLPDVDMEGDENHQSLRAPIYGANTGQLNSNNVAVPQDFLHQNAHITSQGASVESTVNGTAKYDPAQLLDPKGFQKQQKKPIQNGHGQFTPAAAPTSQKFTFDSPGLNGSAQESNDNMNGTGVGSMVERLHGVSDRSDNAAKRRKLDTNGANGTKSKAVFNGPIQSGGVLGDAMKEYRKQGMKEAMAIDLTGDDDEVVVIKETSKETEEVCYGSLQDAKLHAHQFPKPDRDRSAEALWSTCRLSIEPRTKNCTLIHFRDCTGAIVGCLDNKTTLGLTLVMDHVKELRMVAQIPLRSRNPGDPLPGGPCSLHLKLDLTIYGPRNRVSAVGVMLSQKQIWLRTPILAEKETVNPHVQQPVQKPASTSSTVYTSGSSSMRTEEEARSDILGVFDSMTKSEQLPYMEPDPRITTKLLAHQKQGLYFMTMKEKDRLYGPNETDNSSLWRLRVSATGDKTYYNVVTGRIEKVEPPQVYGGILADMMGLGKTLSIISLVVGSKDHAKHWADTGSTVVRGARQPTVGFLVKPQMVPIIPNNGPLLRAKSTLLICPVSTIPNWEEQIKQHTRPESINYYIYHGPDRCKEVKKLATYDLVITTYTTASWEISRQFSPLASAEWFRIVLDEAHIIREQKTAQCQNICSLSAQRRWAVTGTPVQNRLEDLGALLKFIRLKPFDDKTSFVQYILSPMKSANVGTVAKLRILVDSVTLRRLKDKIDLPPRVDKLKKMDFSDEERKLYDLFAKNAFDKLKVMQAGDGIKSFSHILQSITRLRLFCAHGSSLLSDTDMKLTEGLSKTSAIELDSASDSEGEKRLLTTKEAYNIYNFMVETEADLCTLCKQKLSSGDADSDTSGRSDIAGYMMSCMNVLCSSCFKEYQPYANTSLPRNDVKCKLCDQIHRITSVPLKQKQIEEDEAVLADGKDVKGRKAKKVLSTYDGPHTKTKQLVQDLLQNNRDSEPLVAMGQKPIKSVVFSGWTTHLDLIEMALAANGIHFTRLDGSMNVKVRTQALELFKDDDKVTVFLISIAAGGMGLNLTTASRVYVMEPQYNPASEAQAVDRVHRLGQKREVEIVRYIMNDSFEEKMLQLQEKKLKLARMSLDAGKIGKSGKSFGLEELKELFS